MTLHDDVVAEHQSHCHQGDPSKAQAHGLSAAIRQAAEASDASTRNVLGGSLAGASQDVLSRLPKRHSIEDNIRAIRKKDIENHLPLLPRDRRGVIFSPN